MKPNTPNQSQRAAFTLVEMLVVITIIMILAAILIPTIARAKTKAKVANARMEMSGLEAAIKSYHNDYNRWPVPSSMSGQPNFYINPFSDVTFGSINNGKYFNNDEMMTILMAHSSGLNVNNVKNPKKIKYIEPKDSSDASREGLHGLSTSRRYHDPFGNPYIVSIDFNGDGVCADEFYGRPEVSGPPASIGLVNRRSVKNGLGPDVFVLKGEVMIWSFGPDMEHSDGIPGKHVYPWKCFHCENIFHLKTGNNGRPPLGLEHLFGHQHVSNLDRNGGHKHPEPDYMGYHFHVQSHQRCPNPNCNLPFVTGALEGFNNDNILSWR
jgi:type II secretory pathway pseudopilin PulG